MGSVERLIAAGIRKDCAEETVMWYRAQGDDYGLEKISERGGEPPCEQRGGIPGTTKIPTTGMWETARLELFQPH